MSKKTIRYAGEVFSGYNKPKKTPGKNKKFAVLVKDKNGKDKIVRFGDPNMEHHSEGGKKAPATVMPSAVRTSVVATTATRRKTRQPLATGPVTTPGNALSRIKAIRG